MSNKGNILLVANWESNVGYAWWLMENFWVAISKHFKKEGRTCFLIYPKITKMPESIIASDIKVLECDFRDQSITNLKKLNNIIRSNSIQSIYLTDSPSYSYFYLLLRLFGIKKIVVHDHTPGERTPATSWRKTVKSVIQRIPLFTADHFIAVSNFVNQRHREIYMIPAKKCSVTANGIRPYELSEIDASYAHVQFNIPENRQIIVNTGRASHYKGIDFFIRCANDLINKQRIEHLHFLFCGDGPDMQEFQSLCESYNLQSHFTFAGKRTDIKEILPSCDIGFHTSNGEVGYSLSILEYMSAGLATIVPDLLSTSNATRHEETGLLYHHKDIKSACDAIKQCLHVEFRNKLAENAIIEITSLYNINKTNKKLISILNSVYE